MSDRGEALQRERNPSIDKSKNRLRRCVQNDQKRNVYMNPALAETHFPKLTLLNRGKVRDIYDLRNTLLIVATDRISCFDVVLPTAIPGKGRVLTQLSSFWFRQIDGIVSHHLISTRPEEFPRECSPYFDTLRGRSMVVRKAEPLPVECIVRGYLVGSGWKEYQRNGSVCGIRLPRGLLEASRLDEAIFTSSTKAPQGEHDQNISFGEAVRLIGKSNAEKIREKSLAIYQHARAIAEKKGVIIADTKFEFGIHNNELILIDEVLTPDSSRFWPLKGYQPGKVPESLDKQYVRDYLMDIHWDVTTPPPLLPDEVVRNTQKKYEEVLERLTSS
jgi:phosphoribosylaminoimidazole-succinocarboxamide synthase